MWVCYLLTAPNTYRTYIGMTNNFARRLRQHNGELKGGAKYTKAYSKEWKPSLLIGGFETRSEACKFEWASKRAANRKSIIYGLKDRANRMLDLCFELERRIIELDCQHVLSDQNLKRYHESVNE